MTEKCRCGHLILAKACFGCDNSPDECTCDDFLPFMSLPPGEPRLSRNW